MKHFQKIIRTKVHNGRILKPDAIILNETLQKWEGDLQITIGLPEKKGSNRQNSYYWGVIIKILTEELGYEKNEMHDILKSMMGYKGYKEVVNKQSGEVTTIEYLRGYSSYTTQEREDYHSQIRRWASDLGYNIPEPNEVS